MKIKISYIDANFYSKQFENKGIFVLFQKPKGVTEKECESVSSELLKLFLKHGINISSSNLASKITNSKLEESIKKTLYVRIDKDGDYISQNLHPTYGQKYIELANNNKIIAKISFGRKQNILNYICLFAIVLACVFCAKRFFENKRIMNNDTLHLQDKKLIDSLRVLYDNAIDSSNSYAKFIPSQESMRIFNTLDSLSNSITSAYNNSLEEGDYATIAINSDSIANTISSMIYDAKSEEASYIEKERLYRNQKAYNQNIEEIERVERYFSSAMSKNKKFAEYINQKQVDDIHNDLNSLREKIDDNIRLSNTSGDYIYVDTSEFEFESRINALIKEAEKKYTENSKKKNKGTKKTEKKKVGNNNASNTQKNNSRFLNYVSLGNTEYKKYYSTHDVSYARKAIRHYQDALKLKFDKQVSGRLEKLKNEIR